MRVARRGRVRIGHGRINSRIRPRTTIGCYGTGAPRPQETASPQDPTAGLCLGPYGGSEGGGGFLWAGYPFSAIS